MQPENIVIIGSGLGGYMTAKEIRKKNATIKITMLTRDAGRFYSKPQLSTALATGKSIEDLTVSTAKDMAKELDAEIITHITIDNIDREKKIIYATDQQQWPYDKCVLALGANLRKPQLEGSATEKIISINDLQSYEKFRHLLEGHRKICILGSGLVGTEFAHDFCKAGHEVTVVGIDPYPLKSLLPETCAVAVKNALQELGIRWTLNDKVIAIDHTNDQYTLSTASGDSIVCDHALSAIGLLPHTSLAEKIGLKTARGILVNSFLETSDASIYALGDCAEVEGQVQLFVAPLLHCARALAKTLCDEKCAVKFPLMPIVVKTATCPVAVLLPQHADEGRWDIEGEAPNLCAKLYNEQGMLCGFALTGSRIKERLSLMKELR